MSSRRKEHVIGRRFVPKGSLNGCWNLHVWACEKCNSHKADLEDDVSAITLFNGVSDVGPLHDPDLRVEVERKARRSISRRTGRPVGTSSESITATLKMPLISLSATFRAPPQLVEDRANELALFQLRALFFFLTFDPDLGHGVWWRGKLAPANGAFKRDFGNVVQVAFAQKTASWDYRLMLTTAGGYFRVAIRKHPEGEAWSFALEWNDQYRLIGFFGDEGTCLSEADSLPRFQAMVSSEDNGNRFAIRVETLLTECNDILFSSDEC